MGKQEKRNSLLHVIKNKIKLGYNMKIEIMIMEISNQTLRYIRIIL